ncbi:bifunctional dTDP-4-dehydrorhamnose 3,5-epimerase family protein/NAD(P)-dependent oxidoreductase [Kocuria flava]|uniref:bifunctional dTDP-4-dehydrorhamnose 3,5-epimerase family protein/NAD(P)-dependent oxidoreductase n=1 Tax=Kocuria flava TaxID=446860 RepID=UPI002F953EF0
MHLDDGTTVNSAKTLNLSRTPIPGMLVLDLPVYGDGRGWFKENWQREKMVQLGLPDFRPVQNNVSFNSKAGTTRGIHAEPWDKFVSVASGRFFGAWVDLRAGDSFGTVFTAEIDASRAVFVPRGVGNAFQTLEDCTAYTYLVNDHWSAGAQGEYTFLNLSDEQCAIPWPIPLSEAEMSAKDRHHPALGNVKPMEPRKVLVLGANGQLGRALRKVYAELPWVEFASHQEFDVADKSAYSRKDWRRYGVVINAAAYTAVDAAETAEGRAAAWRINAQAAGYLARIAEDHGITLVHISTDYVFDGSRERHDENEEFSPLSVYGQSKAAADVSVATIPRHYIVRTSWVVGDGNNFVRTMASLAMRGVKPDVVDDQVGRLTFADDLARGIKHLIDSRAPYGTYNVSNDGPPMSWAEIASTVYEKLGASRNDVRGVSTEEYFSGKPNVAPRPRSSVLDLARIISVGYRPRHQIEALSEYLSSRS